MSYAEVLLKLKSQTPQLTVSLLVHGTSFHMGFIFGVCFFCHFPTDPVSNAEVLLKLKSQTPQFSVQCMGPAFTMGLFLVRVFPCHSPTDPVSYAEGLLKLKSQQRLEQANLENQLDGEHAKQLAQLREQLVEGAEGKLSEVERETIQRLQAEGQGHSLFGSLLLLFVLPFSFSSFLRSASQPFLLLFFFLRSVALPLLFCVFSLLSFFNISATASFFSFFFCGQHHNLFFCFLIFSPFFLLFFFFVEVSITVSVYFILFFFNTHKNNNNVTLTREIYNYVHNTVAQALCRSPELMEGLEG